MTDFMSDQPAVRCFLSFTHEDDSFLNFVTPLKSSLEQFCASAHGRKIEIFVDRETIGWGEDWRTRIQDGIDASMVFIPAISMNYFYESSACREELTAFYAKANELGLTQLILPLIILGRDLITDDSDDANIRIIGQLQYLDIEEAVLAGAGTAEWRRTMAVVAGKLIKAIQSAERKLAAAAAEPMPGPDEDGPGLRDHVERLAEIGTLLERQIGVLTVSLDDLAGEMVKATADLEGRPKEVVKERIARTADTIRPLSVSIQQAGTDFEATIAETDSVLRSYLALMTSQGSPDMIAQARKEYQDFVEMLGELESVETTITEFLGQIRPLEAINAPLRAAIRPLRVGAQSIQLGIRTLRELRDL
ncbi:toll/interleukin-1 receptor domain-containing protein [Amycolatopsis sp. NBC_01488]|uniref:toll/interleukin-1 receptor domain-containing protein n=1 Tax=Amycolatopsis sp. NBC_01488 TaxID=2903563 RepID=UPI002E2D6551|nr:toll/interleukin-1 receptor domain-containing protein [Amycolatopsis sp. NBC_01488]